MNPAQRRTVFYCLTLVLSIMHFGFSVVAATLNGFSKAMPIMGGIDAGLSLLTWIWISVLLSYRNRPQENGFLVKAGTHFYSFVVIALQSLLTLIMFPTQARTTCDSVTYSDGMWGAWCMFLFFPIGLAILNAIFAAITAVLIRRDVIRHPVKNFTKGMDPMEMNIALADPGRLIET